MSSKKTRYITTTLPYVNSDPHIGFAYEILRADALARYWRLTGEEVFFNTGTDEHGQKVADKADAEGKDRQEYVNHYAGEYVRLKKGLDLSFDAFTRTTDAHHKVAAQAIWKQCADNGDIYKKKYSGLYCVGCELFYKESELLEGNICPIHTTKASVVEEENYFFKLSNYQSYLEEYLNNENIIVPEWRRQEAINFVAGGLEDFSISREKARLNWGVPVPGDDDQVMYVWFDALTNYISTLGWPEDTAGNFKKFWTDGQVLQVAGKDQVRFQSVMWQAMLKSAGVKATDKIVYGGFINSGGQKMSKSLGNVISPFELIERYGTDATRYLLLRHVHPFDDTDVTIEKLDEWYTANLVNGLGNLVARVMKMSESYLEVEDFLPLDPTLLDAPETFDLQSVIDHIWALIGQSDTIITETEPFKLIKTEPEKAKAILGNIRADLLHIGRLLLPIMPETSATIRAAVRANKKPDNLFNRLEK
jgi:methionyl-tRNA synthetase